MKFFCFNELKQSKIIQDDYEADKFPNEYELNDEENDRHWSSFKVKSLFQIMYYNTWTAQNTNACHGCTHSI